MGVPMRVAELMERKVTSCTAQTDLETVATLMWDNHCGSIPVIDESGKPVGIVTDRDITLGALLNHKPLWELLAEDLIRDREVFTCAANDDVKAALTVMKEKKVRRLPVVDDQGLLEGILSIDDVIIAAEKDFRGRRMGLSFDDVVATLIRVCSAKVH